MGAKEFLLAAVATNSGQLKLLRIEIQWGGPGSSSEKKTMPPNARLNPALVETHAAETDWLSGGPSEAVNDASMAELSHLHILPAVIDNDGSSTVPATIVTIRSRVSVGGSFGAAQTILDRWEAVEDKQDLHPAFEQLGARRNSLSEELPNTTKLRKLEPLTIGKVVVGIQTMQFGKIVILTMADGTAEFRDRFTFEQVYVEQDTTKVMNLRQVGWSMSDEGPCKAIPVASYALCSVLTPIRFAGRLLADFLFHDTDRRRRKTEMEQASLYFRRHWQFQSRL